MLISINDVLRYRHLLLVLMLSLVARAASATQYMGGEIVYELVARGALNNTYKVSFRMNRNCKSFSDLNKPVIWFFNSKPGAPHTKAFKVELTQISKTRLSNTVIQYCTINPPDVCNDLIIFSGFIELPQDPNGYLVYMTDCCRLDTQKNIEKESWNGGIEISGGAPLPGQAFTFFTRIPSHDITPVNSSPYPKSDSVVTACLGKPVYYKLDYTDPDGDQLKYVVDLAYGKVAEGQSLLQPLSYANGFSEIAPFGDTSNLHINTQTGEITGTATILGDFVIVLGVQEWRNGVLINTHRRELTLNVVECRGFLARPPVSCGSAFVSFATNRNNPSLNHHWDFGVPNTDADTSNLVFPFYTYPAPGQYPVTLRLSSAQGCSDTVRTTATVYPDLTVDFSWATPICNGTPIRFQNLSSFPSSQITGYRWTHVTSRGSTVFSTDKDPLFGYQFNDTVPVSYSIQLTVSTNRGCSATVNKAPIVYPIPVAALGKDTTISFDLRYEVPLKPSPQNAYLWIPATGVSNARIANPTIGGGVNQCYQLKVWGKDSLCTNTDNICISYAKGPDVYVPSAFTPNSDGLNDRLSFKAVQVQVIMFEIFNRFGQKIFNSTTESKSWDGKVGGVLQDAGIYIWSVKGIGPGNAAFNKSGTIMLLR